MALLVGATIVAVAVGMGAANIDWSKPVGRPLRVTMLQINSDPTQHQQPKHAKRMLQRAYKISQNFSDTDVVVWPENALGFLWYQLRPTMDDLVEKLQKHDPSTALVIGAIRQQNGQYYNSLIATSVQQDANTQQNITADATQLAFKHQIHDKRKMVPFGEYIPFANILTPIARALDIPFSVLQPNEQSPDAHFNLAGVDWIPLICYELEFPHLVRRALAGSSQPSVLLSVSDDSWFGRSIAQAMHLRIHQIRAREVSRFLVRATNNGITAIIDHKGQVVHQAEPYKFTILHGDVTAMTGQTWYQRVGHGWLITMCILLLSGFVGLVLWVMVQSRIRRQ